MQVASLLEEIEVIGNQMANLAVGVANCGSSPATTNLYSGLQFSSQHDVISPFSSQHDVLSTQYYQNQQVPLLFHAGSTAANQGFDSQMDVQLPPLYGWENQNLFDDSGLNPLGKLLEGIDEDNFKCYPWLYNSTNAKN